MGGEAHCLSASCTQMALSARRGRRSDMQVLWHCHVPERDLCLKHTDPGKLVPFAVCYGGRSVNRSSTVSMSHLYALS